MSILHEKVGTRLEIEIPHSNQKISLISHIDFSSAPGVRSAYDICLTEERSSESTVTNKSHGNDVLGTLQSPGRAIR